MNFPDVITVSNNASNACNTSNINQIEELAVENENEERHEDSMFDDNASISEDTSSVLSYDEHDMNDSADAQTDDEREEDAHDLPGPHEDDTPLYDGAQITVGESMHSILTLVLTENLTGSCLEQILKLIALHIPPSQHFNNTIYKFWKYFSDVKTPMKKHYYCSSCSTALENKDALCNCAGPSQKNYFLEIPIIPQLQNMYTRTDFVNDLDYRLNPLRKYDENNIEDIYDGRLYREASEPQKILHNQNNLSFMWYTDGAPVYKSRKYSVWLFNLVINELPYKKRVIHNNILTPGIWFGPNDPLVHQFLTPLHSQLLDVRRGFDVKIPSRDEIRHVKAILLCGTGDAIARSDFLCHVRFNGYYGCTKCKIRGERIRISNNSNATVHIYPYNQNIELRTRDEHVRIARAITLGADDDSNTEETERCGIKSLSPLFNIMSDPIRSTSVDVMHNVFLGVVKTLASLWFGTPEKNKNFSLHKFLNVIDARLAFIKPPSFVPRKPRSISAHYTHWKASEWKQWFFFYSVPILKGIIDDQYLRHYLLLVDAIHLLSRNSISSEMIASADIKLNKFVEQCETLYGRRHMTFNIHSLLHLPQVVGDLGPLWVTSCFPFENLLGRTLKYINGTTYAGLQIYSKICYHINLPTMIESLNDNSEVKKFCNDLLSTRRHNSQIYEFGMSTYALGKKTVLKDIPRVIKDTLRETGFDLPQNIEIFNRLRKEHRVIYTQKHNEKSSFCSYCISFMRTSEIEYGFVKFFLKMCDCRIRCDPRHCGQQVYILIQKKIVTTTLANEHIDSLSYMKKIVGTNNNYELISADNVKNVCYLVPVGEDVYICEPINSAEFE